MKAELQKKLTEKYYPFFEHLDDQKTPMMDPSESLVKNMSKLLSQEEMVVPMQFGFECGDGWFWLLDHLMGNIDHHIKNQNDNRKHAPKIKWIDKFSWKLRYRTNRRIKILKKIGEWIFKNQPRGLPDIIFRIDQIKEKFGGLRFYYSGGDKQIDGMVQLAESLSYNMCESCGTTENVGRTQGWIYTICKSCYDSNERANKLKWEQNA